MPKELELNKSVEPLLFCSHFSEWPPKLKKNSEQRFFLQTSWSLWCFGPFWTCKCDLWAHKVENTMFTKISFVDPFSFRWDVQLTVWKRIYNNIINRLKIADIWLMLNCIATQFNKYHALQYLGYFSLRILVSIATEPHKWSWFTIRNNILVSL